MNCMFNRKARSRSVSFSNNRSYMKVKKNCIVHTFILLFGNILQFKNIPDSHIHSNGFRLVAYNGLRDPTIHIGDDKTTSL